MTTDFVVVPSEKMGLKVKPVITEPSMYQVIMHNDDFTPMEFVVSVLESYFHLERTHATRIMYEVHTTGKAICGTFSRDVAETKVDLVMDHARMNEHPLLCCVEVM